MRTYAVVVGVEQYWTEEACLDGPVRDALAFAGWLLQHGGVEPADLALLLSPPDDLAPPPGIRAREADTDNILEAVEAVRDIQGIDRIWFYFSGHGLHDVVSPTAPVLLPGDFKPTRLWKVVPLNAVDDLLLQTGIAEQLIVTDACRDFAIPTMAEIGTGRPFGTDLAELPAGHPSPYQIRLAAAAPGGTARLIASPRGQSSAFTGALLDGLTRPGPAMEWDIESGNYVVRADQLFRHVRSEAVRRIAEDALQDPEAAPAVPELTYRDGSARPDHPVLREFDQTLVPDVTLAVVLQPPAAERGHPEVAVSVNDRVEMYRGRAGVETAGLVARFDVRPDRYVASVRASDYVQERPRYVWRVYGGTEEEIRLIPIGDRGRPPPDPRGGGPDGHPVVVTAPAADGTGSLEVYGTDDEAAVEVASPSGAILGRGRGRVKVASAPGIVGVRQASVRQPLGGEWHLAALQPGEHLGVWLPEEEPTGSKLSRGLHRVFVADVWSSGRDDAGAAAPPPGADSLTLLSSVVDALAHPEAGGVALERLGLRSPVGFTWLEAPLCVLATYDVPRMGQSDVEVDLRVEHRGADGTLKATLDSQEADIDGFDMAVGSARPGVSFLRIGRARQPWLDVAVPVIEGHLSVVVLHVGRRGDTVVLQYIVDLDAPIRSVHRAEMLQRYVLTGQLHAARALTATPQAWTSPAEGLLDVVLASELGDPRGAFDLASLFLGTPAVRSDALVFAGYAAERLGSTDQAAELYQAATAEDLPVTARAMRLLHEGSRRTGLGDETHAEVANAVARQARETMWTSSWRDAAPPERNPEPEMAEEASATTAIGVELRDRDAPLLTMTMGG